jgi:hypothetical protein
MLRLKPTQTLAAVLGGAVATTEPCVLVNFSDKTSSAYNGDSQLATLDGATPVTICDAPASGAVRDIDFIVARNRDAASVVLTLQRDDGVTPVDILTVTLQAGEQLQFTHGEGFRVLSSDGVVKTGVGLGYTAEDAADKDTNDGYPGLEGFGIRLHDALGTIASVLVSVATTVRTWTFPDKSGTVAMTSDVVTAHSGLTGIGTNTHAEIDTALTRLADTSGENTGDQDLSGLAPKGAITGSGLTMATGKLLGRSTASTGAPEEITVGSGLALLAGVLTSAGGSPGGSGTELQFKSGTSFAGAAGTAWDDTNRTLSITGATVTTSNPVTSFTQTWNGSGQTMIGELRNFTDTASATGSKFIEYRVGGSGRFAVRKDGAISIGNAAFSNAAYIVPWTGTGEDGFAMHTGGNGGNAKLVVSGGGFPYVWVPSNGIYGWSSSTNALSAIPDTLLQRDASGVVKVTDHSSNLRDFKVRGLWFGSTLTVGTLPTASAYEGMCYRVSDANAPAVGSTVASGGSTKCTVQSNGTDWKVIWIA